MIFLSEITFCEFLKDQIKLSDADARRFTEELFLSEEIKKNRERKIKEGSASLVPDNIFDQLMTSIRKGSKQATIFLIWIIFWLMLIFVLLIKY